MSMDKRIEAALHSPEPLQELVTLARALKAEGNDQRFILRIFEDARRELREIGRAQDEDVVLDVMDFVAGWCSPHMQLFPEART